MERRAHPSSLAFHSTPTPLHSSLHHSTTSRCRPLHLLPLHLHPTSSWRDNRLAAVRRRLALPPTPLSVVVALASGGPPGSSAPTPSSGPPSSPPSAATRAFLRTRGLLLAAAGPRLAAAAAAGAASPAGRGALLVTSGGGRSAADARWVYVPANGLAAALSHHSSSLAEAEVAASVADVNTAVGRYDPDTELVVVLEHDGVVAVEVLRPEVPPPVWCHRLAAEAAEAAIEAGGGRREEGGERRDPPMPDEDLYLRP